MKRTSIKKSLLFSSFLSFAFVEAQENTKNFLISGVGAAENIISDYTLPVAEGLIYGLTGGWYNSAKVD